jgi:hypothetical protein
MRAIHTIALLPVITVLCWGQEGGAPKNELGFGLGGLPSLSRSDAPSLNAGTGTGCCSMTAGDSSMTTSLLVR